MTVATTIIATGAPASASGYKVPVTLHISGDIPKGIAVRVALYRPNCVHDETRDFPKTETENAPLTYKWEFNVDNGGSCLLSRSNLDYQVYLDGNSAWGMEVGIRQAVPKVSRGITCPVVLQPPFAPAAW